MTALPSVRVLTARKVAGVLSGGSSRPLLVDTDGGRFVVKLVGGAEGPRALAAEWVVVVLAMAIGIPTAEPAIVDVPAGLAVGIEHQEIREAAARGAGRSFGARELGGARPARPEEIAAADDDFAMRLLWLDTLVENPDRTVSNPNLLAWGPSLVPIDHGAALPFHHRWRVREETPGTDLTPPANHVYSARSTKLGAWHPRLAKLLTRELLESVTRSIPTEWLGPIEFAKADRQRAAYAAYLWKRMRALGRLHGAT